MGGDNLDSVVQDIKMEKRRRTAGWSHSFPNQRTPKTFNYTHCKYTLCITHTKTHSMYDTITYTH